MSLSRSLMPSTCSVTSRGSGFAGSAGASATAGGSSFGSVLVVQLAARRTEPPRMNEARNRLSMGYFQSGKYRATPQDSGHTPPAARYQVQKPIMNASEHQATIAVPRVAVLRT